MSVISLPSRFSLLRYVDGGLSSVHDSTVGAALVWGLSCVLSFSIWGKGKGRMLTSVLVAGDLGVSNTINLSLLECEECWEISSSLANVLYIISPSWISWSSPCKIILEFFVLRFLRGWYEEQQPLGVQQPEQHGQFLLQQTGQYRGMRHQRRRNSNSKKSKIKNAIISHHHQCMWQSSPLSFNVSIVKFLTCI